MHCHHQYRFNTTNTPTSYITRYKQPICIVECKNRVPANKGTRNKHTSSSISVPHVHWRWVHPNVYFCKKRKEEALTIVM